MIRVFYCDILDLIWLVTLKNDNKIIDYPFYVINGSNTFEYIGDI